MIAFPTKAPRDVSMLDLCYWAMRYQNASFYEPGTTFRDYGPALYLGIASFLEHPDLAFDDPQLGLEKRYRQLQMTSTLEWRRAKDVARAAWERAQAEAFASQVKFDEKAQLCAHA